MSGSIDLALGRLAEDLSAGNLSSNLGERYFKEAENAVRNLEVYRGDTLKKLKELRERLPLSARPALDGLLEIVSPRVTHRAGRQSQVDLAVICALKEPELDRVLELMVDLEPFKVDGFQLFKGRFEGEVAEEKRSLSVIACYQARMGMVDCAILATSVLRRWRPRYIAMTGVCGGRREGGVQLGDVIVPREVITYQSGKIVDGGLIVEPRVSNLEHGLAQDVIYAGREIISKIIFEWPGAGRRTPVVFTDPIACGDAVINRKGFFEEDIAGLNRKIIGVDMESYSVLRAAQVVGNGDCKPLIVKAVMDYAESKDSVSDKDFAAFVSARFLYYLALRCLV